MPAWTAQQKHLSGGCSDRLRIRTWISKPDGSCRRPIKDSKVRRNSRLPWVLSFLSYLCLSPWVPGSAAWPQGGQKRSRGTFRIPGRGSQVWPQGGRKHSRGRIRRIQAREAVFLCFLKETGFSTPLGGTLGGTPRGVFWRTPPAINPSDLEPRTQDPEPRSQTQIQDPGFQIPWSVQGFQDDGKRF